MVIKWHGKACPMCGHGSLRDALKRSTEQYKGHPFETNNRGAFCDHCEEGFVVFDSRQEKAWLSFREKVDAHEAAELARIRKKLKLTQMQAGQLAGGGKNAFSRYERGHAKPVSAVVNLFRLLDRHPELLAELSNQEQI